MVAVDANKPVMPATKMKGALKSIKQREAALGCETIYQSRSES
jgi:hypothetical protein